MNLLKSNGFCFSQDLQRANSLENQLCQLIENEIPDCKATTSQHLKSFKEWDIKVQFPDASKTFLEVKEDRNASSTGNIAVELYKEFDGKKENSCLSASTADFFVYYFDSAFHFIKTSVLKKMVFCQEYFRKTAGGNGKRAVVALFKDWIFKKQCSYIFKV